RHKKGDIVQLFNGKGLVAKAKIKHIFKNTLEVEIIEKNFFKKSLTEIILCQGVIKIDKFELLIEKTVELGVDVIIPVLLEHSIVQKERFEKKYDRFKQIIIEAAKQSHRVYLPQIEPVKNLEVLFQEKSHMLNIVLYKNGDILKNIIDKIKEFQKIRIFVGPEGDFTEKEINFLKNQKDLYFITLGDSIFRSETAGIFGTGVISQIKKGFLL
ncbi:MAG: RsmE family RNA methyltransferase, partial [Endomicrobia bacterium]|nr:RsmE family RNA methyltransferase [Endomicrobiia bacterium]